MQWLMKQARRNSFWVAMLSVLMLLGFAGSTSMSLAAATPTRTPLPTDDVAPTATSAVSDPEATPTRTPFPTDTPAATATSTDPDPTALPTATTKALIPASTDTEATPERLIPTTGGEVGQAPPSPILSVLGAGLVTLLIGGAVYYSRKNRR